MTTTTDLFDFDAALANAQEQFDRKADQLSQQEKIVARLESELWQAQRGWEELNREFMQAAQEEDDLMKYLGKQYDYTTANESPTPLEF